MPIRELPSEAETGGSLSDKYIHQATQGSDIVIAKQQIGSLAKIIQPGGTKCCWK